MEKIFGPWHCSVCNLHCSHPACWIAKNHARLGHSPEDTEFTLPNIEEELKEMQKAAIREEYCLKKQPSECLITEKRVRKSYKKYDNKKRRCCQEEIHGTKYKL